MLTIREYARPKSIEEAYNLLLNRENAVIVGGGLLLRQSPREIGLAIDLGDAKLDFVVETDQNIEIGSMATFGDLTRSGLLKEHFSGIIPGTVSGIVGTQFRNMVTVGGAICGKLGFSEIITCLLVLDCRVVLHGKGEISLEEFLCSGNVRKDIMEKIILRKTDFRASYKVFRNTYGSLPILSVAASGRDGRYTVAVGARPGIAKLAAGASDYLSKHRTEDDAIARAAHMASTELNFSDDRKASGEYRRDLCRVLAGRALSEVME